MQTAINCRIDQKLAATVREIAKREDRPVSSIMRLALRYYVSKKEKKGRRHEQAET